MTYKELPILEFYKRCSVCKAIEVDGKTILSGEYYDEDFFQKLGINFSDTLLSKKCFSQMYSRETFGDICDKLEREDCKEEQNDNR